MGVILGNKASWESLGIDSRHFQLVRALNLSDFQAVPAGIDCCLEFFVYINIIWNIYTALCISQILVFFLLI